SKGIPQVFGRPVELLGDDLEQLRLLEDLLGAGLITIEEAGQRVLPRRLRLTNHLVQGLGDPRLSTARRLGDKFPPDLPLGLVEAIASGVAHGRSRACPSSDDYHRMKSGSGFPSDARATGVEEEP